MMCTKRIHDVYQADTDLYERIHDVYQADTDCAPSGYMMCTKWIQLVRG
jgi:hypothetical protein